LGLEDGTDIFPETSVTKYQRKPPDIPEQRRQLNSDERLKSRIAIMIKILLLQIHDHHGLKQL
jgi:hypothetical protein